MNRRIVISCALVLMHAAVFPARAEEKTVTIKDYTGRGFAPDQVSYSLSMKNRRVKKLRLFDSAGTAVPVQVSKTDDRNAHILKFVAELAPNATAAYTLRDSGGSKASTGMLIKKSGDFMELSNALLSVRVPRETDKQFDIPVSARTLPAPILGFKSGTSDWMGAGRILTDRKVKALRVGTEESGPVLADVVYEIQWADGGYYRARIRVIDRVPLAKVTEEYDLLGRLDGSDFWELDLAKGWAPDRMEVAKTHGNGSGIDMGKIKPLDQLMGMRRPRITPDTCPPSISQLGLFNEAEKKTSPDSYTMAGVVPLRKGEWRKMNAILIESRNKQDARIQFPMTARHAKWMEDCASETSPFSMNEHEPGLSRTYGRRLWGLVLGAPRVPDAANSKVAYTYFRAPKPISRLGPFAQARSLYGVVGLDRYKDYILDWPDKNLKYPRLYNKPGTPAKKEAPKGPTRELTGLCNAPISCPTISHHLTFGTYQTAAAADATMGMTDLSPEVRKEMRARLALIVYLFEEPDFISYGNGAHSGNPNMGTCRYMGANAFLPLVADHPMFEKWREHMSRYTEYKMASQIAPGGSYLEYGSSYHMHGYARTTCSLPGLIAAGAPNVDLLYEAYHKPDWDYVMNLLTPVDPRYGTRILPGLANAGPGQIGHFLEAAGSFADMDREFASAMKWAWEASGSPKVENQWIVRDEIKSKPQKLTSRIYPGFGAILRAHQGPNETYMLLRSGFDWSHWYIDQGHMVVMSRGAVLLPYQSYAYYTSPNKAELDMHNTIRFGHQQNEFPYDWPDGNVLDHAFGPSVDYVWASTGIPDWFIDPGVNPAIFSNPDINVITGQRRMLADGYKQTQGAFEWNRQILFLKGETATSPNYFVIRDSMPGDGKLASYLFLKLLGRKKNLKISGGHVDVDTEWDTKMDITFVDPGKIEPEFFEENHKLNLHHAARRSPGPVRDWVKKDGTPMGEKEKRGFQQHVFLRIPGEPGAGYMWLMYPRSRTEESPEVERLAAGAVKVTHREGEDYAFLSPSQMTYTGHGIEFEGCTGTVRVRGGKVTLALTGGEGRIAYKGREVSGMAPIERILSRPGVHTAAAPKTNIRLPADVSGGREIAPGIREVVNGRMTRYIINAEKQVIFGNGRIGIEARRASIEVTPESIRFVAPDSVYVKLTVGNVGVRGVGPFDLAFSADRITGRAAGRIRTIVTTWPENIVRPMFHMDGVRYFAGWADDHCIAKGQTTPQLAIAFGVTDGEHEIRIDDWTYPELPPTPPRRKVGFGR